MSRSVLGLLFLLWGQLFFALHPWWSERNYYDYGWIVPLAACWFFWQRNQRLPAARSLAPRRMGPMALLLSGMAALAFLVLLRFGERSDPFWRIPFWLHAIFVAVIHHAILWWHGYPSGFAWITCFAFSAVPLPSSIEHFIVDSGTGFLAWVAEPLANFQGLPVLRCGKSLMADGEVLDVQEGCSGIRSLQGLLMTALFCGELFQLTFLARIGLLVLGVGVALVLNTVRTMVLVWVYFEHGRDLFESVHDGVGRAAFLCSVVLTGVAAWQWGRVGRQAIPARVGGTAAPPPGFPISG